MMKISREKLQSESRATGFRPEMFEKAIHLLNLLGGFQEHSFLKDRIALKGGTALNLFLFDLPRLSVDIDLNYIGSLDRKVMEEERPKVEQAVQAVCSREGLNITRMPDDHAGGKWRLRYESALGEGGNLELDLNFMFRIPLWPVAHQDSRNVGSYRAKSIPVLDVHELAAGKLAALLSRHASRDLFDAHLLLTQGELVPEKLRLAFVLYGAMNRKDWRTVKPEDVEFDDREIENQLVPVIRRGFAEKMGKPRDWAARLVSECRRGLGVVLPMTPQEREFLDRLLDHGELEPHLLTNEVSMVTTIETHPLLQWKALNVRKHKKQE
jgi:predicted nucleotidyltransferase component of viral defense system